MLADTLVLPLSSGNITLRKINQDGYSSEFLFRDAVHQYRARVRHTEVKATATRPRYDRHNFEVVETVFALGDVAEYDRKVYWVHEHTLGDTSVVLADGIADLAIASSNAFLTSLLGWES